MSIVIGVIVLLFMIVCAYAFWSKPTEYEKAKKEIFIFVKDYKKRCTGNNRFIVTVEYLQDSFREYDMDTIEKVWRDLIDNRVIDRDPLDNEWCVR